jgi:hypothetical protein
MKIHTHGTTTDHEHQSSHLKPRSDRIVSSRLVYLNTKFLKVQLFVLLFILGCFSAASALAQVQSLGDLSFVVPERWRYDQKPGSDVSSLTRSDGRNFCTLFIIQPFPKSNNLDRHFARAWYGIITPEFHDPLPDGILYEHRLSGYLAKFKGAISPGRGQNRYVLLFLLETPSKAIPVVVVASDHSRLYASLR